MADKGSTALPGREVTSRGGAASRTIRGENRPARPAPPPARRATVWWGRPVSEHLLSAIWQAQWLRRAALRTTDGRSVRVVYRGRWSHGLGPDFRDALLVFDDGPLLRGDIEVHRRAADWAAHGHQHDPRYAAVILHVTYDEAAVECRRPDGAVLPQVALAPVLLGPLDRFQPPATLPLGALGDGPCANHLVATAPERLLATVRAAGLARLRQKAAVVEASFTAMPPDQSFYAGLLEALGYSQNRAPALALAAALPLQALDDACVGLPPARAQARLAALLLGAAGFLPWRGPAGLRLRADFVAAMEREWQVAGAPWRSPDRAAPRWELGRVRPANHPARRLLGLAVLLAAHGPARLPAALLALARDPTAPQALRAAAGAMLWPAAAAGAATVLIGADRAGEIAVNVVLPHALARAAAGGDAALAAAAEALAAVLPAGPGNARTRAMLAQFGGPRPLPIRSALEEQGLLHLYAGWCASRRCYECPVAAAVSGRPPA